MLTSASATASLAHNNLDAAVNLGRMGYRVHPLKPQMKAARVESWQELATSDATQIAAWWGAWPDANIGIVGGNGLLLLDVDPRKGGDVSLAALEQQHGALPPTMTSRTPSGGRHLYFAGPDVANSSDKVGAGLDIKSRRGYVVAPPSYTVAIPEKQSEGSYQWVEPMQPIAAAPQWLIDLAGAPKTRAAATAASPFTLKLREATPEQWADIQSALDYLTTVPAVAGNGLWTEIGYALKSLGDNARELWCEWSARAPGYDTGAPEIWWDSHGEGVSDFRALFNIAAEYGWVNPRSRAASLVAPPPPNVPVGTVPPPPPDAYTTLVDRTDTGNANLLIAQVNGTLRYVAETKQWLRWTGTRWQLDEHEVFANASALEVAKIYMHEARRLEAAGRSDLAETQAKWAAKCRNKTTLDAMLVQARKAGGVPISVKELDRDPLLLGVENGVVDLRTGELRPDAREDFITKRCIVRYEPAATAPRWQSFIAEITGEPIAAERDATGEVISDTVGRFSPRPALASYLHKALGYAITGLTKEQKFFIAIGEGSNGKSVVFDTVKTILGPYAFTLPSEAFVAAARGADSERPTALAASLAGARFVVASETKEGQRLDISVVKNHTGDKEMTARRMRENPVTFAITHKPWLCTNAPPALDHMDPATRGRLHVIPFDRRWNRPGEYDWNPALPAGDKDLSGHLERETEGILAWLVRGAVLYQREGLKPPQEVVALTRDYVMEQDHFARWLAGLQRCPAREGAYAAELFGQFAAWCVGEAATVNPATQKAFSTALKKRSVETFDDMRGKRYGLRTVLQQVPPPPSLIMGINPAVVFAHAVPPPPPAA